MSSNRYNLRKRISKPSAATPPCRKASKKSKATASGGISKTYIYTVKPSTMARLAEMEVTKDTTLVEGVRFHHLSGGSKRAPRGVVVMKISVPASVEGGEWPQEMDVEEIRGEEEEEVERQTEAEAEAQLEKEQ